MKRTIMLCTLLCTLCVSSITARGAIQVDTVAVKEAVDTQLRFHPQSTLRDIYKSFFQDYYGPGHIINNPEHAKAYLIEELEETPDSIDRIYELTGSQGRFVRLDLSAVKAGIIPLDTIISALTRSATMAEFPPIDEWIATWRQIEAFIAQTYPSIPALEADSEIIEAQLANGDPAMHHSQAFSDAYNPHYRIIHRDIFLREILPLFPINPDYKRFVERKQAIAENID